MSVNVNANVTVICKKALNFFSFYTDRAEVIKDLKEFNSNFKVSVSTYNKKYFEKVFRKHIYLCS